MYRKSLALSLTVALFLFTVFTVPTQSSTSFSTATTNLTFTCSIFDSVTDEQVNITATIPLSFTAISTAKALTTTLLVGNPFNVTAIGATSGYPYQVNGISAFQLTYPPNPTSAPVNIPLPLTLPISVLPVPNKGASPEVTTLEYGTLAALIAVTIIAAITTTGTSIEATFIGVASTI